MEVAEGREGLSGGCYVEEGAEDSDDWAGGGDEERDDGVGGGVREGSGRGGCGWADKDEEGELGDSDNIFIVIDAEGKGCLG